MKTHSGSSSWREHFQQIDSETKTVTAAASNIANNCLQKRLRFRRTLGACKRNKWLKWMTCFATLSNASIIAEVSTSKHWLGRSVCAGSWKPKSVLFEISRRKQKRLNRVQIVEAAVLKLFILDRARFVLISIFFRFIIANGKNNNKVKKKKRNVCVCVCVSLIRSTPSFRCVINFRPCERKVRGSESKYGFCWATTIIQSKRKRRRR